jgi:thiol-disulfide isomerase/thioredoxin
MYKSRTLSSIVIAMLVCPWTTDAFQTTRPANNVPTINLVNAVPQHQPRSTALRVVADRPMEKEDETRKTDNSNSNNNNKAWIETDGGFVPNLKGRLLRRKPSTAPLEVTDMFQYKDEVVDVQDQIVCVRFYAPWCKACKAVEGKFRRLAKDYPSVKFVEVPVTKENARLHQALQVPSLPFAHIYEPSVGLVVERKINKNVFGEFKSVLNNYVQGECGVNYDEDGYPISA